MEIVKNPGGYIRTNNSDDDKAYADALRLMEGKRYNDSSDSVENISKQDALYKEKKVHPSK